MAKSKTKTKIMNMAYGLGASVVIIGALFKITHMEFGFITGNLMLTLGLVSEALIFALSAFEPVDDELDWSKVYPELAGGEPAAAKAAVVEAPKEQLSLSKKLDTLLKDAKIDAKLMSSLSNSIKNFEGAAKGISPAIDSLAASTKYGEEMSIAASQMESLNSMYKLQLQSVSRQATINKESIEDAQKLKDQMKSLASNLSSLNGVYGGMLTAMVKK